MSLSPLRNLILGIASLVLVACGDSGSGIPSGSIAVSNATPSAANGTYALSVVTGNTAAGITQVKIADPGNSNRSLQIFYDSSNALTSLIYTSPETAPVSLMTCIVGNAITPCPSGSAVVFDLPGKKITFTNATFTLATIGVGTLNGTVFW